MYKFLSTKQNEVSALLTLPGYEAGRSQALVKAEGEVTLKEICQLLRLDIGLVNSMYIHLYMEIVSLKNEDINFKISNIMQCGMKLLGK